MMQLDRKRIERVCVAKKEMEKKVVSSYYEEDDAAAAAVLELDNPVTRPRGLRLYHDRREVPAACANGCTTRTGFFPLPSLVGSGYLAICLCCKLLMRLDEISLQTVRTRAARPSD